MKRLITLLLMGLLFNLCAFAGPIDQQRALQIANKFLNGNSNLRSSGDNELKITFVAPNSNANMSSGLRSASEQTQNLYYVINRGENNGFVVVAGNDVVSPILAYSETGNMTAESIQTHPSIAWLFSEYEKQLKYAIENDVKSASKLRVYHDDDMLNIRNMKIEIEPLFRFKNDRKTRRKNYISFGQDWPFNDLCPNMTFKDKYGRKRTIPTVSGCVATGISMVMRWHEWPLDPVGKVSYKWNKYTMSLDFDKGTDGETAGYDWKIMPESVDSYGNNRATRKKCTDAEADQIARLLRDVGYSVKMNYGIAQQGGSGTQVYYAPPVLMKNFGYADGCQWIRRSQFRTKAEWIYQITDELKNYGPIIYAGFSDGGGHCFCLDGYATDGDYKNDNQPNDFVHVNWGWNKMEDGWYKLDILKPGSEGIGGGSGGYKTGQQMVRYLQPDRKGSPKPETDEDNVDPVPASDYKLNVEKISTVATFLKNKSGQKYTITVKNEGDKSFYGQKIYLVAASNKQGVIIANQYTFIGKGTSRKVTFYDLDLSKVVNNGTYDLWIAVEKDRKVQVVDEKFATCRILDKEKDAEPIVPQKVGPEITLATGHFVNKGTAVEGSRYKTTFVLNNSGDMDFNGQVNVYVRPISATNTSRDQKVAGGNIQLKQNQQLNANVSANLEGVVAGEYQMFITYTVDGKETYVKDDKGYHAVAGTLEVTRKYTPRPEPKPVPEKEATVAQSISFFYQGGKYLGANNPKVKYYGNDQKFTVKTYLDVQNGSFTGDIKIFVTTSPNGTKSLLPTYLPAAEKTFTVRDLKGSDRYAEVEFNTYGMYMNIYYIGVMYKAKGSNNWRMMPYRHKAFYVDYSSYEYKGEYSDQPTKNSKEYIFEEPAITSIGDEDIPEREDGANLTGVEESIQITASIYPTVATEQITIVSENATNAEIFNMSGVKVKTISLNEGKTTVSVSDLYSGTYVVRMNGNSLRFIKK